MWKCCEVVIGWFSKDDPTPVRTEPLPVAIPPTVTPVIIKSDYDFDWNNKAWSKVLVTAIKESSLIVDLPILDDREEFGYVDGCDPVLFWGRLMVAMAKWESNYDPESTYMESFGLYSRGLFQVSLVDANRYGAPFTTEESVNVPELNIIGAVKVLAKLVSSDIRIGGKVSDRWKGGARYWSVLRGTRSYTAKALSHIKDANNVWPSTETEPVSSTELIDLDTTVVIGHNSGSQGAVNYKGMSEFEFNSVVAFKMVELFTLNGYHINTKKRLPGVSYSAQVNDVIKYVMSMGDDTMICLHFNSASKGARGVEVLIPITASLLDDRLADIISDRISVLGIIERKEDGVFPVPTNHNGATMLYGGNRSGITTVLPEPCFANYSTTESRAIFEHVDRYVKLLCNSILEFKGLPEIK